MYLVHHYNFGAQQFFGTLAAAKAYALRCGFDCTVWHGEHRLATFSSISGWRVL